MPSRQKIRLYLTPESRKFVPCDFSPSAPERGTGFLLDLPTVPGTAKPVKSRLQ